MEPMTKQMANKTDLGDEINTQKIAEEVGREMFAHDKAAQALGIRLLEISPGYAKMSMEVREDMLNGFAICHGGMTFSLADTTFAYACNSRNQRTVALSCTITYAGPGQLGDTLIATATEEALNNRTGVYDIVVTNQRNEKVAFFRGNSYNTKRPSYATVPAT
jgi:acyl-CoA thioesterase